MRHVLDAAKVAVRVCLAVLLVGAAMAGWKLWPTVRSATANVATAAENLREGSKGLSGKHGVAQLLYNLNIVTAQVGRTANTVRLASVEERKQAAEAGEKLIAAIGEFNALLASTNGSLNGSGGVLPALSADLVKTGAVLDQVKGEDGLLAAGTKSLGSVGAAVDELRPELKRAATSAADAMGHVDGAAGNVETTTGYIKASFAPKKVSFWGRVAGALVPTVLRSVWSAVFPERVKVVDPK